MSREANLRMWLVVVCLLTIATAANAKTIYVDADANGSDTGTNWANAYPYLQDALADANTSAKPVEIRVAQGTYTPDSNSADPSGSGDRTATFQLINDVNLMGGFAGYGEADPDTRDVTAYETFLSGDLNANDVQVANPADLLTEPTRGENSYHVVTGTSTNATAVLDGFTITAGNANETDTPNRDGAGMINSFGGTPTVLNCTFSENSSNFTGGGMYCYDTVGSGPAITNCSFTRNYSEGGGGIYTRAESAVLITDCTFTGNQAGGNGGGIFTRIATLTNCTFIGNSADKGGGARVVEDLTLIKCAFTDNQAVNYGGGLIFDNGSLIVVDCTFSNNHSDSCGGAITTMLWVGQTSKITNCTFSGNSADSDGGAYATSHDFLTFTNCTFSENQAGGDGGAFNIWGSGETVDINNCIFWGNTASGEGPQIAIKSFRAIVGVNYSDVQGGEGDIYDPYDGLVWGSGNIGDDLVNDAPLFVDADGADDTVGTEDDDLRLAFGSPCIDVGDNNSVPADINDIDNDGNTVEPFPWDLDGRPRIIDGDCNDTDIVDMGAYEFGWLYLGDFAGGCDVDFVDFAVLGLTWRKEDGQAGYDPNCDISLPADSLIDEKDLKIFTDNWLSKQ